VASLYRAPDDFGNNAILISRIYRFWSVSRCVHRRLNVAGFHSCVRSATRLFRITVFQKARSTFRRGFSSACLLLNCDGLISNAVLFPFRSPSLSK
jgi:hypothetical protein